MNSRTSHPTAKPEQADLFGSFDAVAGSIGQQIAASVLARIKSFPSRESLLGRSAGHMDSLPEDILWDGLGEEAAPVFVVYKLIHEAFSNAPQFFRSAIVEFLRAQPERFSAVFNRETIWSVMAALPTLEGPESCPSVAAITEFLTRVQQRGIWWRSDAEVKREAEAVHKTLESDAIFRKGFAALRAMQTEKAQGITAGNLLLMVPGRLAAYADEVVRLGRMAKLPPLAEIHARIDEFTRDREIDPRHLSIPLDLLYTTTSEDTLHVRILVRAKANTADRSEIRRRSIYLRYFLRRAFAGYKPDQINLKLAFYLDSKGAHVPWHGSDSLFHSEEWTDREHFWNDLCPGADPEHLFAAIREAATLALTKENVVSKLRVHFASPRPKRP